MSQQRASVPERLRERFEERLERPERSEELSERLGGAEECAKGRIERLDKDSQTLALDTGGGEKGKREATNGPVQLTGGEIDERKSSCISLLNVTTEGKAPEESLEHLKSVPETNSSKATESAEDRKSTASGPRPPVYPKPVLLRPLIYIAVTRPRPLPKRRRQD